jgi:hypothetical protein
MTEVHMRYARFAVGVPLWLAIVVLTFPGCHSAIRDGSQEAKPLAYVGQLQFGIPVKRGGQLVVPIAYRDGQWAANSAVVPVSVVSKLEGNEIEITVITSVGSRRVDEGYQFAIPDTAKGRYMVYYRDPRGTRHGLGSIEIAE